MSRFMFVMCLRSGTHDPCVPSTRVLERIGGRCSAATPCGGACACVCRAMLCRGASRITVSIFFRVTTIFNT